METFKHDRPESYGQVDIMSLPEQAFEAAYEKRPYKGKRLADWLARWVNMSNRDLYHENSRFLTIMCTWVVRKFQSRGNDGVPTGYLAKFCLPETQKVRLLDALASQVIFTLRKRGLVETDTRPTDEFWKVVEAFDRAHQQTSRR